MPLGEDDLCWWPVTRDNRPEYDAGDVNVYGFTCCTHCGEHKVAHILNKCLFDSTLYMPARKTFNGQGYFTDFITEGHPLHIVFTPEELSDMTLRPLIGPVQE